MTNVVRHSGAREAAVRVTVVDQHIHVEVNDDGTPDLEARLGMGLRPMQERAEELGGSLVLERRADHTCLDAVLRLSR